VKPVKPESIETLRERCKWLREALDRADALASVQAQSITVLEGACAVYANRVDELRALLKVTQEAH
jgi:hypothetical protein